MGCKESTITSSKTKQSASIDKSAVTFIGKQAYLKVDRVKDKLSEKVSKLFESHINTTLRKLRHKGTINREDNSMP